ncbi:MAG TPA: PD-(D/E)XK nuclease family protein [Gammaproteobacteria bacterium]|nr:PD-(D/E)XK nuclease family protein [Gammaproteobacteria bacterium]
MKLTPNRRLAVYLRGIPLNTWLEAQYAELCLADPTLPYRLSSNEETVIWEEIIAQSDIGKSLLKTSSTARLAQDAWLLSVQWRLPQVETLFQSEDNIAFSEWVNDYQVWCKKKHYVDSATFIDQIINAIDQKKLNLPAEITLTGFEELTPQLALFFEKVKEAGSRVKSEALVSTFGNLMRISVANTEQELRYAILKSKQWLTHQPEARIGIVVPALREQRALVIRILEEAFTPASFNVAAPIALKLYPLIDSALLVLRFFTAIPLEKFSRFLRSPFFNNASLEKNIRAALDVMIRDFSETAFTLEGAIKKIELSIKQEPKLTHFTGLADLQKLVLMRAKLHGKQRASFWRDQFSDILHCVGWPGDRLLTPEELEIIEQWQKVLTDYVSMERVLGEHRYLDAVSHLQRLLQNTTYSPSTMGKTRGSAPIQVLGILEALGMPFDYLWVTGLYREAWPPEPAPNPLIPLSLQRQYDLPRSSAARELKMARQFTERLSQGGKEVVFSYPQMIEERPVSASPLIIDIPEVTDRDLGIDLDLLKPSNVHEITSAFFARPTLCTQTLAPSEEEVISCIKAPNVGISEKIKGGSHILKLQALCPFRAFAETRLHAKPMPKQSLGLNAAERGEIIHQILEYFWEGLSDQTALLAMPKEILENRIRSAIENIFSHWQARYPRTLTPQYLRLEKKRTYELIERFIALEKSRPYFEVVSTEKKRVVNVEGLEIKIRIDRIDRLENQSEILVDYKTGEVSISNWFGERPKDPQLPLYCVTEEKKPSGIVFGVIRPDAIKYQGLVEEGDALPGVKTPEKAEAIGCATSFAEQYDAWKNAIALLAREFMQGVARVEPIEGENTCRTCSLKPLCRINSNNQILAR